MKIFYHPKFNDQSQHYLPEQVVEQGVYYCNNEKLASFILRANHICLSNYKSSRFNNFLEHLKTKDRKHIKYFWSDDFTNRPIETAREILGMIDELTANGLLNIVKTENTLKNWPRLSDLYRIAVQIERRQNINAASQHIYKASITNEKISNVKVHCYLSEDELTHMDKLLLSKFDAVQLAYKPYQQAEKQTQAYYISSNINETAKCLMDLEKTDSMLYIQDNSLELKHLISGSTTHAKSAKQLVSLLSLWRSRNSTQQDIYQALTIIPHPFPKVIRQQLLTATNTSLHTFDETAEAITKQYHDRKISSVNEKSNFIPDYITEKHRLREFKRKLKLRKIIRSYNTLNQIISTRPEGITISKPRLDVLYKYLINWAEKKANQSLAKHEQFYIELLALVKDLQFQLGQLNKNEIEETELNQLIESASTKAKQQVNIDYLDCFKTVNNIQNIAAPLKTLVVVSKTNDCVKHEFDWLTNLEKEQLIQLGLIPHDLAEKNLARERELISSFNRVVLIGNHSLSKAIETTPAIGHLNWNYAEHLTAQPKAKSSTTQLPLILSPRQYSYDNVNTACSSDIYQYGIKLKLDKKLFFDKSYSKDFHTNYHKLCGNFLLKSPLASNYLSTYSNYSNNVQEHLEALSSNLFELIKPLQIFTEFPIQIPLNNGQTVIGEIDLIVVSEKEVFTIEHKAIKLSTETKNLKQMTKLGISKQALLYQDALSKHFKLPVRTFINSYVSGCLVEVKH